MPHLNVLPTELAALVEHIELHESGWWDRGLRRCIAGAVWHQGSPVDPNSIPALVSPLISGGLRPEQVEIVVSDLIRDGVFVQIPDGSVKVTEETAEKLSDERAAVTENEAAALEVFARAIGDIPVAEDVPHCWEAFQDSLLLPLISEFGARTYELLVGEGSSEVMDTDRVDSLVAELSPSAPERLRAAFLNFLDPTNPVVRSFILRRLTASFFVHAAGVSPETLDMLDSSRETTRQLIIFVDTNYLFSILGLHDNPSNEAAQDLLTLVSRVSQRIDVKLRVLPITMEETRRVVRANMFFLEGMAIPSNLARAGLDDVSQLTKRYLEAAAASSTRLSAADFFRDYDEDLLTVLRDRGVDAYNEDLDEYRTRQDVIDAIHDIEAMQEQTLRGPKRYEANLHDMVVWHVAADKRPAAADSPLDARYWIATVDFGLMRYDKRATRSRSNWRFSLCLHPAELMQLLLFWVPRDETFEAALIGAMRHPFLTSEFDSATEKVTVQILSRLSRYESIDDLSPDAIARILENDAVRTVFAASEDESEQDDVIHNALVEELERLQSLADMQAEELESAQREAASTNQDATMARDQAARDLEEVRQERDRLKNQLNVLERRATDAEMRADAAKGSADDLQSRVVELEKSRADQDQRAKETRLRRSAIVFMSLSAVTYGLVGLVVGSALGPRIPLPTPGTAVLIVIGLAGLWLMTSDLWLSRHSETADWLVRRWVHTLNRFSWWLVGGVLVSFLGAWLFDSMLRS